MALARETLRTNHPVMRFVTILLNPRVIVLGAFFLSVIWMLRDERDKTRPILVIAFAINFFYGMLLNFVMGQEDGLVPWKYDHVLASLDASLGVNTPGIASALQGGWRLVLTLVYDLLLPMMIVWYAASRYYRGPGSIAWAFIVEMLAGPLFYAIVPACGPIYAFRTAWLHPPAVRAELIRLSGTPNAFPSLHVGTALVFVFFSRTRGWRWASVAMLAGTALATLATGEHYAIDLIAGVAFGCFAAYVGYKRPVSATLFLGFGVCWSLAVRFQYLSLVHHPYILRTSGGLTVLGGLAAVAKEWMNPGVECPSEGFDGQNALPNWQSSITPS